MVLLPASSFPLTVLLGKAAGSLLKFELPAAGEALVELLRLREGRLMARLVEERVDKGRGPLSAGVVWVVLEGFGWVAVSGAAESWSFTSDISSVFSNDSARGGMMLPLLVSPPWRAAPELGIAHPVPEAFEPVSKG